MKNLWKMSLTLLFVCGIAAGSLALVNRLTKPKIEQQAAAEKLEALKRVIPEATRFEETPAGGQWDAYSASDRIGVVIEVLARGYGGPIDILVGMDLGGRIKRIRVLNHNETPGLGAKITDKKFSGQFEGMAGAEVRLRADGPAGGKIDAITAATISSRAVTDSVRKAVDSFTEKGGRK